jgi:hypothetical protein
MKILGCAPKYRMFIIGVSEQEYQEQIAPLMATLRLQHREDYPLNYVSPEHDVDFDLKDNQERQNDPSDSYRQFMIQQYDIEANEFPRFFLLNRSLTKCFSIPPDYPFLNEWNGHSPFYEMEKILTVSNLLEVVTAPMRWNGKARKEGYEIRGPLQQQSYVDSVEDDIHKQLEAGVSDQQILESIRYLYMDDQIDDETLYHLNKVVGYGLRSSWYLHAWPDRKVYDLASLGRFADDCMAMTPEEAACHIDDYHAEGLSDKQILFTVCGFYLQDKITDQDLTMFFQSLKTPLPEHFKSAKTPEQKKDIVKRWMM